MNITKKRALYFTLRKLRSHTQLHDWYYRNSTLSYRKYENSQFEL